MNSSTRFMLKTKTKPNENYFAVRDIIKEQKLHTFCEEASCPNKFECYGNKTATFLILGNKCTRNCLFCFIGNRPTGEIDWSEPYRVAEAVTKMGLHYAVVTSVCRDDLEDGGASSFAETIKLIRKLSPGCLIEILTPDFQGNEEAIQTVLQAEPDVFNHNIETVKRLYPEIRPQADYNRSMELLKEAKHYGLTVKSGLMVGLGENQQEIIDCMHDIRATGADILTIGQYLRPTPAHREVKRFYRLQEFSFLKQLGLAMNFKAVESMPLVRSSYKAFESYNKAGEWQWEKSEQAASP